MDPLVTEVLRTDTLPYVRFRIYCGCNVTDNNNKRNRPLLVHDNNKKDIMYKQYIAAIGQCKISEHSEITCKVDILRLYNLLLRHLSYY